MAESYPRPTGLPFLDAHARGRRYSTDQDPHRPLNRSANSSLPASKSGPRTTCERHRPGVRGCERTVIGTRRATGRPARAITISSPASTRPKEAQQVHIGFVDVDEIRHGSSKVVPSAGLLNPAEERLYPGRATRIAARTTTRRIATASATASHWTRRPDATAAASNSVILD